VGVAPTPRFFAPGAVVDNELQSPGSLPCVPQTAEPTRGSGLGRAWMKTVAFTGSRITAGVAGGTKGWWWGWPHSPFGPGVRTSDIAAGDRPAGGPRCVGRGASVQPTGGLGGPQQVSRGRWAGRGLRTAASHRARHDAATVDRRGDQFDSVIEEFSHTVSICFTVGCRISQSRLNRRRRTFRCELNNSGVFFPGRRPVGLKSSPPVEWAPLLVGGSSSDEETV